MMQVHTNAPPIESVHLSFDVPFPLVDTVLNTMRGLGLRAESDSIPWREALGVVGEYTPAMYVRGIRLRENLTQKQLSERTGISVYHISAMENNKRAIGKKNARILAQALNIDPRHLLSV